MTSNQIAYHNLLESRRANQVKEAETYRHNREDEAEKGRQRMANTRIAAEKQAEVNRSNLANEDLKSKDLDVRKAQNTQGWVKVGTDIFKGIASSAVGIAGLFV